MKLVWFKRDLRIQDHEPLWHAAQHTSVLPLYIVEPELWRQSSASDRQWQFVRASIESLQRQLSALGQPLWVIQGDAVTVLQSLVQQHGIDAIYAHMETGEGWTFQRDNAVHRATRALGVPLYEYRQQGVVRGLKSRGDWATQWEALMAEDIRTARSLSGPGPGPYELPERLDARCMTPCQVQAGGSEQAHSLLDSFLSQRGREYTGDMSSPLSAAEACSRLSPHIAHGTISIRQILRQLRSTEAPDALWARSYRSFDKRLHWHCHFIQKLESEPRLEFEPLHRGFLDLHPQGVDHEVLERWIEGETGWPFVDACMRCLKATGWINFRMRAMLASLSAYHLWQPWQQPAHRLAQRFVDYEAGIHYSQFQMQSGTTGINVNRMYNPIKQSRDQDPEGEFIRAWVPELEGYSSDWIHEPLRAPIGLQDRMGQRARPPISDPVEAARQAKKKLTEFIRSKEMAPEAQRVLHQHGSRMRQTRPKYKSEPVQNPQGDFGF